MQEDIENQYQIKPVRFDESWIKRYGMFFETSSIPPDDYIRSLERRTEKELINLLRLVGIESLVKTEPYSLPYQSEITIVIPGESYFNAMFESHRTFRTIVKELLEKDIEKIRFYFYIEPNNVNSHFGFGSISYKFRYYRHR